MIEPPHVLAFTWLPDWQQNPTETLVRFDLTEKDGLTTVRLTHSGLRPEGLQAHKGWPQILVWLRGFVASHHDPRAAERRSRWGRSRHA